MAHHGRGIGTGSCYYNISLFVIILCILGAGAFLAFSGLKNRNPDRCTPVHTAADAAASGGVIPVMILAVLVPIAECRAGGPVPV